MTEEVVDTELLRAFFCGIAAEVMDVHTIARDTTQQHEAFRITGQLRVDPRAAYTYVEERFQPLGYTPLLRQEQGEVVLLVIPGRVESKKSRLWLSLVLFVLTVVSTYVARTVFFQDSWANALAYSIALLSILLVHELGHFLVARRMGVTVSFPFFIPVPTIVGTLGAVIAMKGPPPDRRALFSIAIAGPLAGLVLAVPVLLLGLHLSDLGPFAPPVLLEGNSLLYAVAKWAIFGRFLPDGAIDVNLHPIAFAGWVGLLVTGLNLIPAGQLDGGHILYALVGEKAAQKVTWGIITVLLLLGFKWYGWFLWAVLIFLFGNRRAVLLNELVPLNRTQKIVAVVVMIIFALIFTPVPFIFLS